MHERQTKLSTYPDKAFFLSLTQSFTAGDSLAAFVFRGRKYYTVSAGVSQIAHSTGVSQHINSLVGNRQGKVIQPQKLSYSTSINI
jgi:DNA-binding phage protein